MTGNRLLDVNETATRLGIGRTTVFRLIREGTLQSVKLGALRRIRESDLEAYIDGLNSTSYIQGVGLKDCQS